MGRFWYSQSQKHSDTFNGRKLNELWYEWIIKRFVISKFYPRRYKWTQSFKIRDAEFQDGSDSFFKIPTTLLNYGNLRFTLFNRSFRRWNNAKITNREKIVNLKKECFPMWQHDIAFNWENCFCWCYFPNLLWT